MTNQPLKISVVVPLYNKAAYVVEALESVMAQTYEAYEIIVVDDGSTDDSVNKIAAITGVSIRLIKQANAGVSVARNTGIKAATGDIITFLDADDRYLPGFLAAIAQLASDFPSASVFATAFHRFTTTSTQVSAPSSNAAHLHRGLVSNFYSSWSRSSFFCTDSVGVRTVALRESNIVFPPGERLGEDQDVWFRLAERFPLAFDPAVLSEYRVDVADSATRANHSNSILPCYRRLAQRLQDNTVPIALMHGARRLVASHYLNVARAKLSDKDIAGALQLIRHPLARANSLYFLRTATLVFAAKFKNGLGQ